MQYPSLSMCILCVCVCVFPGPYFSVSNQVETMASLMAAARRECLCQSQPILKVMELS